MSKNLTRKGIALGAVIALGTTLFAGAPAFAADELTLAPSAGTGYKTIEGEAFKLLAAPAPATSQANIGQLKYQVVTTATLTAVVDTTSGADTLVTSGATQPTNTNVYSADNAAVAGYAQSISLDVTSAVAAGTPATAVVTAFWDANSDGLLTAGEYTSPARTVTWVDIADSGATVALTQPITGDTTAKATLSFASDINTSQIRLDAVAVQFSNNVLGAPGTADVASGAVVIDEEAALNTDGTLGFSASVTSIDSGDLVSAQATYLDGDSTGHIKVTTAITTTASSATQTVTSTSGFTVGASVVVGALTATTVASVTDGTTVVLAASKAATAADAVVVGSDAALGSKVVAAATARTLDQIKIAATAKSGVKTTTTGVGDFNTAGSRTNGAISVRSDVTAYDVVVTVYDGATTPAVIANQAITVNVTDSNVVADDLVTLNGAAYDGTSKALALTTNADGQVTISVAASAADASDALVFNATAQNVTTDAANANVGGQTTATWTAISYTAHAGNSNGNVAATTDGVAVSIPVTVVDQWGDAPAAGYDVLATWDATGNYVAQATTASTAATEAKSALVDGKATLVITDNGTGVGVHVYDISVAKLTGLSYGSPIATIANFEIRIKAAADLTAGLITVSSGVGTLNSTSKVYEVTTAEPLALTTFGTNDARTAVGTAPTGFAAGSDVSLAGNVKTAATAFVAGALIPGTPVTFTGAGLQFKSVINSSNVYTVDSATVYTDGSGAFNVTVYGNNSGTKTVTITSGSVTQVVTIVFAEADDNSGTALSVVAPATVDSGKTLLVTGSLTDKYGNPVAATHGTNNVKFAVTYDGPGLLVGSLPTATDAKGAFSFRVLLGATDVGTATVSATYDEDTTVTSVAAITKSATVSIVDPAAVAAAAKAAAEAAAAAAKAAAELVAAAKTVTLTLPATTSQAGRALDVSVKVLNTAGAATAGRTVTFKSTGVGYLASTTAVTDANGVATVKLIAGNGDIGTSTVTATVDGVTSAASNVEFGVTDADVTVGGRAIFASVEFAKGKTVTVFIDGKRIYSKLQATDAYTELKFTQKTAGKHVVTIRVSGGTSVSETVVTTN